MHAEWQMLKKQRRSSGHPRDTCMLAVKRIQASLRQGHIRQMVSKMLQRWDGRAILCRQWTQAGPGSTAAMMFLHGSDHCSFLASAELCWLDCHSGHSSALSIFRGVCTICSCCRKRQILMDLRFRSDVAEWFLYVLRRTLPFHRSSTGHPSGRAGTTN